MTREIAYGEDAMARIRHAIGQSEGAEQLRWAAVEALNDLACRLCAQIDRLTGDMADAVVRGTSSCTTCFWDCR